MKNCIKLVCCFFSKKVHLFKSKINRNLRLKHFLTERKSLYRYGESTFTYFFRKFIKKFILDDLNFKLKIPKIIMANNLIIMVQNKNLGIKKVKKNTHMSFECLELWNFECLEVSEFFYPGTFSLS